MFGNWTLFGLGVLALGFFILFYWLSIFVTVRAILAFVGTILVGFNGYVGSALAWGTTQVVHLADWLLGKTLGPAAIGIGGTLVTIVALVIFVHDLHPKKTATKRTGWAGIALAALLLAGVSGIPALNSIVPAVRNGVSTVKQIGG